MYTSALTDFPLWLRAQCANERESGINDPTGTTSIVRASCPMDKFRYSMALHPGVRGHSLGQQYWSWPWPCLARQFRSCVPSILKCPLPSVHRTNCRTPFVIKTGLCRRIPRNKCTSRCLKSRKRSSTNSSRSHTLSRTRCEWSDTTAAVFEIEKISRFRDRHSEFWRVGGRLWWMRAFRSSQVTVQAIQQLSVA